MKYIELVSQRVANVPKWIIDNTMFEGLTGSVAYAASDDTSDMDIVGFYVPPKNTIFPHLDGEIIGFGTPRNRLSQYTQHHVILPDRHKEVDITLYSIVKFFQLAMENNPNMVDVLYLPRRCVLHSTEIYEHVRENRSKFLHKGCWHKMRGYAYSQLTKLNNGTNRSNPKRQESIEKYGYDTKFCYHIIRLMLEAEQILLTKDLNLEENGPLLRSIRNGEWTVEKIVHWFNDKEKQLEALYHESTLRHSANENEIKQILLECIEMHYGSVSSALSVDVNVNLINDIEAVLEKYR